MFQFHTVQLKGAFRGEGTPTGYVSIPYGSIKGLAPETLIQGFASFQFHTVQLKVL